MILQRAKRNGWLIIWLITACLAGGLLGWVAHRFSDQQSAVDSVSHIYPTPPASTLLASEPDQQISPDSEPEPEPEPIGPSIGRAIEDTAAVAAPTTRDREPSLIGSLSAQLEREKSARQRLTERVARLDTALAEIKQQLQRLNENQRQDAERPGQATRGVLDTTTLMAAGFSPSDAAYLSQRWGEQEMAALYLRDQAIREGWIDTPRYLEATRELRQGTSSLREEIDPATYDQLLFASGQPNRIAVEAVIDSSPAQTIGLQAGDIILSYDGNRIYSGRDLRAVTTTGDADIPVAMQVERNGQLIEFYIPRGPIGVRLDAISVQP